MTVAEVAATLKLNPQTIRNWIDAGKLPAHRLGRRVRVRRSDFDQLIHASHSGSETPTRSAPPTTIWDGVIPAPAVPLL
jgi:excisionase family DNA binding protein